MSKKEDIKTINEAETWAEIVGPIVAKLHVASAFGKGVEFSKEGAINIARLLASMARRLDGLKSTEDMTDEEFKTYTQDEMKRRSIDNLDRT